MIAERDAMRKRIAELEEALRACDRYFAVKKSWDNQSKELIVAKAKTRAVLGDAPKSPEEIESAFRRMLADPAIKREVRDFRKAMRPTAEDMSRRFGDAPEEDT